MTGTAEKEQHPQELQQAAPLAPDVIYQNNIYALVDDLKQDSQFIGLTDEEIKNNRAFFPRLVQYIYNNYIGELLGNKEYNPSITYPNIEQLDYLFNIYIDLVGKYKWNNRPSLLEYSLLTGISRDTIYNWLNGDNDNVIARKREGELLTRKRADTVRKWQSYCEQALVDGNGEYVKEIFLLKAKHGYRDNNNDITITVNHKPILSAEELPKLIDLKEQ